MQGVMRLGLPCWRGVSVLAQQQSLVAGERKFYADFAQNKVIRNTSKVLSADKKGTAVTKDKVTLYALDGTMSIISLVEAEKLAKRRGVKLQKQTDLDGKSQRPVYQLVTIANKLKEDSENKTNEKSKSDKMLSLNNKIAEHDLQSRLKHIEKWLTKAHKVVVVISGSTSDLATSEKIVKQMEEVAQGKGRIVQKRTKGSEIRFQIMPINPVPPSTTTATEDKPINA